VAFGHEAVKRMLTDAHNDLKMMGEEEDVMTGNRWRQERDLLKRPPGHRLARRAIGRHFIGDGLDSLRYRTEEIAAEEARRFGRQFETATEADLTSGFCYPYTDRLAALFWGRPDREGSMIRHLTDRALPFVEDMSVKRDAQAAFRAIDRYCRRILASKRRLIAQNPEGSPSDSPVLRAVRSLDRTKASSGGRFSEEDVRGALRTLFTGSPTIQLMAAMAADLAGRPDAAAACAEDIEEGIGVVEEEGRFRYSFLLSNPRRVVNPAGYEIVPGVTAAPGETVIGNAFSALHDPRVAERPNEFDPRQNADRYLWFGAGKNRCPAKDLSNFDLAAGFRALFAENSALELVEDPGTVEYTKGLLPTPRCVLVRRHTPRRTFV
jgi:cytochrome P450